MSTLTGSLIRLILAVSQHKVVGLGFEGLGLGGSA